VKRILKFVKAIRKIAFLKKSHCIDKTDNFKIAFKPCINVRN